MYILEQFTEIDIHLQEKSEIHVISGIFRNFPGNEPGGVKGLNSKLLNFISRHVNLEVASIIQDEGRYQVNVKNTVEADSSSSEEDDYSTLLSRGLYPELEMKLNVDNRTKAEGSSSVPELELNIDNTTEAYGAFSEPEEKIPNPKRKKSLKTPILLNSRPLIEFLSGFLKKQFYKNTSF